MGAQDVRIPFLREFSGPPNQPAVAPGQVAGFLKRHDFEAGSIPIAVLALAVAIAEHRLQPR